MPRSAFAHRTQIPMPLDQAVLDHRVIGRREGADGNRMMDVLAVAARRDMVHLAAPGCCAAPACSPPASTSRPSA